MLENLKSRLDTGKVDFPSLNRCATLLETKCGESPRLDRHEPWVLRTHLNICIQLTSEHLSDEQLDERRRFQTRFDSFSLPVNRKRYRRLFKRSDAALH